MLLSAIDICLVDITKAAAQQCWCSIHASSRPLLRPAAVTDTAAIPHLDCGAHLLGELEAGCVAGQGQVHLWGRGGGVGGGRHEHS